MSLTDKPNVRKIPRQNGQSILLSNYGFILQSYFYFINGIELRGSILIVDLFDNGELKVSEIVTGLSFPICSASQ